MATERTCTELAKDGTPCKAHPLKDKTVCLAHADAETRESVGFIADNGKGGRPKNPRAVDVLRERIEQDIDKVLDPLWNALEADRGLALTVRGGGMEIGYSADHPTRIQAARELLDRAYGRPKQTSEISGPDGGPVELLEIPIDAEQRSARAAALLAKHGHTS